MHPWAHVSGALDQSTTILYIHPFVTEAHLSVLPQLIQHFVIYTTTNKGHFKTNPSPYKCNKLIPDATPFATASHMTCATRRHWPTGQGEPLQVPEYDAIPWYLGSASNVTLDDVEVLEVREEGFGIGGRRYGVKKRR